MPGPLAGFGTDIDTDALYRRIVQLERFSQDPNAVAIGGGSVGKAVQLGATKVPAYLGVVATRGIQPITTNASYTQLQSKSRHVAMDAITSLQLVYSGWYTVNPRSNGNVTEVNAPGAMTITAAIEYPIGTRTQVKFGGAAAGTLAPGANLISDAVIVNIPIGAAFYIHLFQQAPSGIIYCSPPHSSNWGEAGNIAASGLTDLTMAGNITNAWDTVKFLPSAVIGMTSRPTFAVLGDSKGQGALDTYSDGYLLVGEIERSLGKSFAFSNFSVGGEQMSDIAGGAGSKRLALANAYCSHVICEYGINDFKAARTSGQCLADMATIRGLVANKPFYQTTVTPVSTSTDSWATTANQTTASYNGQRTTFNANIRNCSGGSIDGYIEVADQVESARDSGIWKAGYTTDGTHENQTAAIAIRQSRAIEDAIGALV